jgi:mono/diheme cytochrome c family protein
MQVKKRLGWLLALYLGSATSSSPSLNAAQPSEQAAPPANTPSASAPSNDSFETAVKPMIQQNCIVCHNAKALTGGLNLQRFLNESAPEALKDREVWEKVDEKLKAGEMPPPGMPRPAADRVTAATQWIEQQYAFEDRNAKLDPGRVTVRRLNRFEYTNTVRDLLGVNLRVAEDFPPDPYAYGFDNVGDALSLSPVLTEMYLKAAERVAKAAIPVGEGDKALSVRYASENIGQQLQLHVETIHDFPVDGQYNLRFQWEKGEPAGTVLTGHIYIDDKEVLKQSIVVTATLDRTMVAPSVPISQGPHRFEVAMEVAPDAKQPKPAKDVLPYPSLLEVAGPFHPLPYEQTASFKRIFFNGPVPSGFPNDYAREILTRVAHRAYRRPPTKAEVDHLMNLAKLVHHQGGSFYESMQVALEGVLMSPNFLFRIEQDPPGDTTHRISDPELASRLSYFLWSSMPDDELLALAENNTLHQPEVLHAQMKRMLADPRARSIASNFGGQWLETRNLQFQKPDPKMFPGYDLELRDDMETETEMFIESVIQEDRSILDFLNGKYTFLNQRLAEFYGIPGVQGREFRRVDLNGTERSGIITQASVLTASSYPTRTSPTIRGKWVLTNILNTPPPAPPANVPALADTATGGKVVSVRERLEMHRSNPVCASCHSRMDPLGFALENYDAVGRWRTSEDGLPVDASGRLPDGKAFSGGDGLKALLMANSSKFVDCLTEKLLTYALGRGVEPYDRPAVLKIENRVENNGYRFTELVGGIVDSAPFQMRHRQSVPDGKENVNIADKSASKIGSNQENPQ